MNNSGLINDTRYKGKEIQIEFNGQLTEKQEEVFYELSKYNEGVLSATTGERVIIVMGAVCVIKLRVPGTFTKDNSCIA